MSDGPIVDPKDMYALHVMPGHLIRRLNQISMAIFNDRITEMGLDLTSVQFCALIMLSERPGIDQATLAGLIAYDRATIGGVLDRLDAKGLISRQIHPRDRRARMLKLTPAGDALLAVVLPEVQALQHDILAGLPPEDRSEFLRLLQVLTDAGNELSRAPLVLPESR
ncbi:MarR family winged helix-turn-helix transcriptional regulator [Marinibacterium profundimaris]|nr:MarR family transcriptional regulator [Marinibacterium profundimaris]